MMTVSLPGATSLYVSAAAELADALAAEADAEVELADALAADAEADAELADALPDELLDVQPTSASAAARTPAATSATILRVFMFIPFLKSFPPVCRLTTTDTLPQNGCSENRLCFIGMNRKSEGYYGLSTRKLKQAGTT